MLATGATATVLVTALAMAHVTARGAGGKAI
jgi:hypothetical protein